MEQKTRKRSLREICKAPNSMTEEEKVDMLKMFESFREFGKAIEPYSNIKPILNNTTTTLSKRFYQEHFIMSAVLEAFFLKNEISFAELNKTIINYVPKGFVWDISVTRINLIISKMIRLGLVEPIGTENKYAPKFKITLDGVKAYQAHTFQTLATSSFFSYQTYQLNKKMLWVTIISVIVAITSIVVTIWATTK
jgi:hypothetical protein